MTDSPPQTPREQSRVAVGRLTKLLAGLAVAATAAFGAVVASGSNNASGTGVDGSSTSSDVVSASSSTDDVSGDFDLSPNQGVWSTTQAPSATSGGS